MPLFKKGRAKKDAGKLIFYLCPILTYSLVLLWIMGLAGEKAEEMKGTKDVKRKSMGLQLTRERLANLNKQYNTDASFEMEDLYDVDGQDSGTKVVLKIRLESGIGNLVDRYSYVN